MRVALELFGRFLRHQPERFFEDRGRFWSFEK
jgi:hypothetical protein